MNLTSLLVVLGMTIGSLVPPSLVVDGHHPKCVADGCKAIIFGANPPPTCPEADWLIDVDPASADGACKCPVECEVDKATCKSKVTWYFWPTSPNHWASAGGDCSQDGVAASSDTGAAGCGTLGAQHTFQILEGLCGGTVVCQWTWMAMCRACTLSCT